jgi:hypothetical protein
MLGNLAAAVRNESNGELTARVVYSYEATAGNLAHFTSLEALVEATDTFGTVAEAMAALTFGANGTYNADPLVAEVGFGLQIQPAPDSAIIGADVTAVTMQGRDAGGTVVFDTDDMVAGNTATLVDNDVAVQYDFNNGGEYNVLFTFTSFNSLANGGNGSNWVINNFVLATLDADDAVTNANTLTMLDLSAFGVTEANFDDLDFGIGGNTANFGVTGEWVITLTGIDTTQVAVQEALVSNLA